ISGVFEDGEALLEVATQQGLEGVMAKKPDSRYYEGRRTRDWLKIKTHGRQEFVICGWTKGQGRREGRFGALVLGAFDDDGGLRDDKTAQEVHRENPVEMTTKVKLSNLDKVFFPDEGLTKGDLLEYYHAVAPVLLPHLRERPFTMRRYPDGAFGKAFFQKDAPSHMPDWIPTYRVQVSTREAPRKTRWIRAPIVNDEDALLWMVNMGCIDMNTWYSRV